VPSLGQHVRHNMLVSRVAAEATRSVRIEPLLASGCRRRRLHPVADGGALPRPARATQYARVASRRRGDAVGWDRAATRVGDAVPDTGGLCEAGATGFRMLYFLAFRTGYSRSVVMHTYS